jgi:hypothetical protein
MSNFSKSSANKKRRFRRPASPRGDYSFLTPDLAPANTCPAVLRVRILYHKILMVRPGALTRRERLRRVVILCCQFIRNLAYYRVGGQYPTGWKAPPLQPTASFWRIVNGNFIDACVLEWCKLLGDTKGQHCWDRISNPGVSVSLPTQRSILQSLPLGIGIGRRPPDRSSPDARPSGHRLTRPRRKRSRSCGNAHPGPWRRA